MISSMVLFLRRDCAGGAGPTVDAPRPPAVAAVDVVAPAPVVAPVVGAAVVAAPPAVEVVAGDDVAGAVVFVGLLRLNIPPAG